MESLNKKALVELVAQKTGNTKKDTTDLDKLAYENNACIEIERDSEKWGLGYLNQREYYLI